MCIASKSGKSSCSKNITNTLTSSIDRYKKYLFSIILLYIDLQTKYQ